MDSIRATISSFASVGSRMHREQCTALDADVYGFYFSFMAFQFCPLKC